MNVLSWVVTARRSVVLVLTVMLAAGAPYFGAGVRQSLVSGGLTLQFAGSAQTYVEIERVSAQDLLRAELLIAPIAFILLLSVFGSLTAAVLPLAVGVIAVVTNTAILQLLTEVTPVSTFALNVTTALGFGLAIDYSLFMISRFRDESADGAEVGEAVHRTVRTAGLTVVFSALTVALSLSALPAVLGHRVDRLGVLSRFRRRSASTFWRRLAMTVMRRPILIATAVVGLLLILGSPFLSPTFSLADDRVMPASAPARQAAQVRRLHDRFGLSEPASPAIGTGGDPVALREVVASSTSMSSAQGRARHDA